MKIQFLCFLLAALFAVAHGDNQAALGQYPWHAYLWMYDGQSYTYCDGALIRNDYILTAAHCIYNKNFIYVRMGTVDLMAGSEWYTYVEGNQFVFVYTDYNINNPFNNDIGLIHLYDPAVLSSNVQLIALPLASDTNLDHMQSTVTGFGTSVESPEFVLRHIQFPIMPDSWCQLVHEQRMQPNLICTDTFDDISPCLEDSGSPLHTFISGANRIVGVGSIWDEPCSRGHHGVFTRVTAHLSWINSVLAAPPPPPPPPPTEPPAK